MYGTGSDFCFPHNITVAFIFVPGFTVNYVITDSDYGVLGEKKL